MTEDRILDNDCSFEVSCNHCSNIMEVNRHSGFVFFDIREASGRIIGIKLTETQFKEIVRRLKDA